MKKENLTILANTKESSLGLGDYLRILTFIPNLKYKNIYWISNSEFFPIIEEIDFIKKYFLLGTKESKIILEKSNLIFNLYENGLNTENLFFLNSLLKNKKDIKIEFSNLLNKLSNFFKINDYKLYTNKFSDFNIENDVFCSWKAPREWSIKEYPMNYWLEIKNQVESQLNRKVIFQNKDDNLKKFILKIKCAKLIVSINNLAVHIAILFNKPIVMLAGPNYLNDIEKYSKAKVIFPENFCEFRPCYLPTGVNNCGCMGEIKVSKIFSAIKKIIL